MFPLNAVLQIVRIMVQPAKPASPIWHLSEDLPKVNAFLHVRFFTTWCAPFPNRIFDFKVLAMALVCMLCSLLTRTQGGLAFT